jgi:hypothetical protein
VDVRPLWAADSFPEVSRTPLIRTLLIGCLATVSAGCGITESLPGGKLRADELAAMLERQNTGSGPFSCTESNGAWDFVCTYASPKGEPVKIGVDATATGPKEESVPVPIDDELPTAGKSTGRERAAFAHRIEAACTARARALTRLPASNTRAAYLESFTARRLAESNFAVEIRHIAPPKLGMRPLQRLRAAAQARVEAVDAFHDAVVKRDLTAGRVAFAEMRSTSLVVAREAGTLGAACRP